MNKEEENEKNKHSGLYDPITQKVLQLHHGGFSYQDLKFQYNFIDLVKNPEQSYKFKLGNSLTE